MPNFCVKCGAPLSGGPFCVKCGADMRSVVPSVQPQSPPSITQPPSLHPASETSTPASAKQGMSTLAKLGIAAVAIIFVGGAAGAVGVYYVAHRVSQKIHQTEDRILGSSSGGSASGSSSSGGSRSGATEEAGMGDVCRFLSKEDVTKAIGVEIIRTEPTADSAVAGCSYVAKGTQQDMTAKHTAAMAASRGADQKTQQLAQNIASGMFQALAQQKPSSEQGNSGEVPVFSFSVSQHDAEEMMRMSAKGFSNLGDTQGLPGIGDQAFVSGDGMIMVRKGKNLVTIMFLLCPCGVEAVKPLAKEIADAL